MDSYNDLNKEYHKKQERLKLLAEGTPTYNEVYSEVKKLHEVLTDIDKSIGFRSRPSGNYKDTND